MPETHKNPLDRIRSVFGAASSVSAPYFGGRSPYLLGLEQLEARTLLSGNPVAMMGDSFQYEAFDGTNYSSPATASISFMGTYQPQVQSGNYSVLYDHALNVAAPGVLAGSSDPNHIHLTAILESNPSHGSVTVNADGSFVYTPSLHYAGPDTFGIAASDGNQTSTTATEQITVTDIAPTASGVPVVQPAHGAFPELLAATGGGVLVPPHDAEQLAQTLHNLLLDRAARLELGRQGRQRVLGDFNADRMAAATLEIYQAYLADRPPHEQPAPIDFAEARAPARNA